MAGTLKFELVSPERVLLSADAQQVILPGAEGIFTVLQGHAPVITNLLPGVVRVTMADGIKGIFVKGGFAEVSPDSVTVLAERAFITDEVDPRQIEAEIGAAQKALDNGLDDDAKMHITRAIDELRALVGNKVTP